MAPRKPTTDGPGSPAAEAFEVLPAIDLLGGRVVRLVRGDYGTATAYSHDPAEVAVAFARDGASVLHIVDLDAARDGRPANRAAISDIVAAVGPAVRCEVAGGLRDEAAVEAMLAAGASRVVAGTAALRDPTFVGRLVARFGSARIAVALDVRDGLAVGHGWVAGAAAVPVTEALARLSDQGVEVFEVTAIDRDGTMGGPDLDLLGALVGRTRAAVVASAGISSADDLRAVRGVGCVGAIVGRALYEGRLTLAAALAAVHLVTD